MTGSKRGCRPGLSTFSVLNMARLDSDSGSPLAMGLLAWIHLFVQS